ncbi:MAG: hypothetical protein WB763_01565 [Terriglobia bacterium]|jgi:hypothetical protein
MATALPILDIQEPGADLARKTVFIKLHLGLLGNSRKVSSSQVAVDADKALIRVSKTLLDSPELQAIRTLDGDIRHFLYDMCLPFEVGIHLLPLGLVETVDERLHEFKDRRGELVESFLSAYPRLCQEAAGRLRTLYNPADYPPVDEVRSHFTFSGNTSAMACRNSFERFRPNSSKRNAKRPWWQCRKPVARSSR